jgi:LAO/AO transport system kinase
LQTVALEGNGITEVVDAIARHQAYLAESDEGETRRRVRIKAELEAILRETLLRRLMKNLVPADLAKTVDRIAAREIDPHTAAKELLARLP